MNRINQYIQHRKSLGLSASTLRRDEDALWQFEAFSHKNEQSINSADIQQYYKHLQNRPICAETVIIKLTVLKRYFSYLTSRRELLINPADHLELKHVKQNIEKETKRQQRIVEENDKLKNEIMRINAALKELKKLDAGKGEKIPTLEEVLN